LLSAFCQLQAVLDVDIVRLRTLRLIANANFFPFETAISVAANVVVFRMHHAFTAGALFFVASV
jgi:hypothetical protein